MFALFDRISNEMMGKPHQHKEAAWVEAYERKLVMQGRMGANFEHIELLRPDYEIREITSEEAVS